MGSLWLSKILRCSTHHRFNRIFDKMEAKGYALFMLASDSIDTEESPYYQRQIRNYIKNLNKLIALYDKFLESSLI